MLMGFSCVGDMWFDELQQYTYSLQILIPD